MVKSIGTWFLTDTAILGSILPQSAQCVNGLNLGSTTGGYSVELVAKAAMFLSSVLHHWQSRIPDFGRIFRLEYTT